MEEGVADVAAPHRALVYLLGAAGAGWPVLRAALRSCRPPLEGEQPRLHPDTAGLW